VSNRKKVVGLVAIGVVACATIGLVIASFISLPDETEAVAPATPAFTAVPDSTPPLSTISAPTRQITGFNGLGAWRATLGSCPSVPASIEYTTDAGATWLPSTSATSRGLTNIISMHAVGSSLAIVGQSGTDCGSVDYLTTAARTDRLALSVGIESEWYLRQETPGSLYSPSGLLTAPCATAVEVEQGTVAGSVGVLCNDQTFFRSRDGGATWDTGLVVAGAQAFTPTQQGYLVATVGDPNCAGVQLRTVFTLEAAGDGQAASCRVLDGDLSNLSISASGEILWMWAGDTASVSVDRGATWN
jgi:hypothetical protein